MITKNITVVRGNIQAACEKVNRPEKDVTLVAVSKTMPVSDLREAYEAGCRDFGENKVQELCEKQDRLPKDIRWHMIGHLQRNKVKQVVGRAALIHGVDSLRLAEAISREAVKKGCTAEILLEVNVAGEESKFGGGMEEAGILFKAAKELPNLQVKGLMTVAPYAEDPEGNRVYFRQLKTLAALLFEGGDTPVLSMGMTGDYQVAIEEGATVVRVGTGIFGNRAAP